MERLVIFDLDGTLLNTIDDLGTAVNHALALRGLPQHTMEQYTGIVGHGVRNLITKALPADRTDLVDECLADFRAYYMDNIYVHTRPYAGMSELVHRLQDEGCRLAVASNKFQSGTEKLIGHFFGDIRWTAVFGNREGMPLKPDAALIREIEALAGPVDRTILVGDSDTDMKTALNAAIPSIAVTWGFRTRQELVEAGAVNFADTADDVHRFIKIL